MNKNSLAGAVGAIVLTAGAAAAQGPASTDTTSTYPDDAVAPATVDEDDGMDLGWLGLLGLVGLLGLRKRPAEHVRTHSGSNTGALNR